MALCESLRREIRPDLQGIVDLSAELFEAYSQEADVMLALAQVGVVTGLLDVAESALLHAWTAAPEEPRVFQLMGEVCLHRRDSDGAQQAFAQARELKQQQRDSSLPSEPYRTPMESSVQPLSYSSMPPSSRRGYDSVAPSYPPSSGNVSSGNVPPASPSSRRNQPRVFEIEDPDSPNPWGDELAPQSGLDVVPPTGLESGHYDDEDNDDSPREREFVQPPPFQRQHTAAQFRRALHTAPPIPREEPESPYQDEDSTWGEEAAPSQRGEIPLALEIELDLGDDDDQTTSRRWTG